MDTKLINITLIFISLVLGAFLLYENSKFPVNYEICKKGFIDCWTVAKFDDMDSCQSAREKGGWYCNQTDKSKITCEEKESDMTDSLCTQ